MVAFLNSKPKIRRFSKLELSIRNDSDVMN
jgi:hypothetical protein